MKSKAVYVARDAGDPALAQHLADDASTGELSSEVPAAVCAARAVTGRP